MKAENKKKIRKINAMMMERDKEDNTNMMMMMKMKKNEKLKRFI